MSKTIKTCVNGHKYDHIQCPVCPVCTKEMLESKGGEDFKKTSVPAQNALAYAGIISFEQLSQWSEKELLKLHGFGPKSIVILTPLMKAKGLSFRK